VALDDGDLLGRAHIGQREHHIRCLLLQADAAQHDAQSTRAPAQQSTKASTDALSAGIRVLTYDVRDQHVVRSPYLALADVRFAAQISAGCELTLLQRRLQPPAAVDQREALALGDEHLDERFRRFEVVLHPPLLLGLGHGQGAESPVAGRKLYLLLSRGDG